MFMWCSWWDSPCSASRAAYIDVQRFSDDMHVLLGQVCRAWRLYCLLVTYGCPAAWDCAVLSHAMLCCLFAAGLQPALGDGRAACMASSCCCGEGIEGGVRCVSDELQQLKYLRGRLCVWVL